MKEALCLIAFGANLGDPKKTYQDVKIHIIQRIGNIVKESSLYSSKPMVSEGKSIAQVPQYHNGMYAVKTSLSPLQVLEEIQAIEKMFGRKRDEEGFWGSRPIDLDVIAIDEQVVSEPHFKVPHPYFHERDFVLIPLREILPEFLHPVTKESIEEMLEKISFSRRYLG